MMTLGFFMTNLQRIFTTTLNDIDNVCVCLDTSAFNIIYTLIQVRMIPCYPKMYKKLLKTKNLCLNLTNKLNVDWWEVK